ncbi:hypothetical protein JRO89_XS01G0168000 [Xanthoceras sorbifolium]|uniref:Protein TIC 20 n=1 Tax=Xanthoceras sorbifolium TaxID=99658 RepID=A0ABQ8IJQ0_9ROSI|nr:hypothetical protein JRO89_XS01G0168000 [Xanthoceras sorbifolium]
MATGVAAQTCRNLVKPSPFLAPVACRCIRRLPVCSSPLMYKNVIQERCAQTLRAYTPSIVTCNPDVSYQVCQLAQVHSLLLAAIDQGTPHTQISSKSSLFLCGDQDLITQTRRQRSLVPVRAAAKDTFSFRIPAIKEKPEWWWRTLACVPYLIALQISDVGYYLQPFSQHYELFENLIFYVPGAITRLPSWFTLMYCFLAYCWVVKNKEWPLFFRFHLMMGMLLETGMQICWYTSIFCRLYTTMECLECISGQQWDSHTSPCCCSALGPLFLGRLLTYLSSVKLHLYIHCFIQGVITGRSRIGS